MGSHYWWQVHAETGDLVVEYNSSGGNSQEKEDVQEVAIIESTRRSCCLQKANIEAKITVAGERASAVHEL